MTLDYPSYQRWRQLYARFRAALSEAMAHRAQRNDFVDSANGPQLAWVLYERDRIHAEINKARAEEGLPTVAVEMVLRAETSAVGHVDYLDKLARYCADIVLDHQPWGPRAS